MRGWKRWVAGWALGALSFGGCGDDHPIMDFPAESAIRNVIVIVQENHSFDDYFGTYCEAPTGSSPTCTEGRTCCEAAPATDPKGHAPLVLDDASNAAYDPDHTQACMVAEVNGGAMDGYVEGPPCADARNFAIAGDVIAPYWDYADRFAIADNYFHSVAGSSSANDMYFAAARFQFLDNTYKPFFVGESCSYVEDAITFDGPSLGAVFDAQGVPWRVYAEGIDAMRAAEAQGMCPKKPAECHFPIATYPCVFDPGDIPFAYYVEGGDDVERFVELDRIHDDIEHGTLPAFSFVKFIGYKSEHPGLGNRISEGVTAVTGLVDAVLSSRNADRTLVLLTWDESGGYFDHVPPPPDSTVDGQPYGPRVALLALGRFARKGYVSHVQMEHSSIVRFLEWNFLGGQTGQLGARDAVVSNIGSLLDPEETGVAVPE